MANLIEKLLTKTSRTFALSIPMLPAPLCKEVGIAYLLFRIADTFEDEHRWSFHKRIVYLRAFKQALHQRDLSLTELQSLTTTSDAVHQVRVENDNYQELLGELPHVLNSFWNLPERSQEIILSKLDSTIDGMVKVLEEAKVTGEIRLTTVPELREYCYIVAGLVGEMLTDLFIHHQPVLEKVAPFLRSKAKIFGEALQLVNILKDRNNDAKEQRFFLDQHELWQDAIDLVKQDLEEAQEYTHVLKENGASKGVISFTALPVLLARVNLRLLLDIGSGAKITRSKVAEIMALLQQTLDSDAPIGTAFERV